MRGNLFATGTPVANTRSIPARAGEPASPARPQSPAGVYPRACGGTGQLVDDPLSVGGLSPRVRGNPSAERPRFRSGGSIPARAGEPVVTSRTIIQSRVYPRACGGTAATALPPDCGGGLSPRVRGNRAVDGRCAVGDGSIPARAGEPRASHPTRRPRTVYPRACGGTEPLYPSTLKGVYPRTRNRWTLA